MSLHGWFPVAAARDLPAGHVYQTMLAGRSLAIWRAASGGVNIWEDRCPHRGVRFSVGSAVGDELRCQYHGWRFAAGTGACILIPAHPKVRPAAAIHARSWPVAEAGGLVWTGDAPGATPALEDGEALRAIPVNREADVVEAALIAAPLPDTRLFVQPVEPGRCVIRGTTPVPVALRTIDAALERLRRALEAAPC